MKKIIPSLLPLLIFSVIMNSTALIQTNADTTVLTCEYYNREEIRTRLTWSYHDMKLLLIEKASDIERLSVIAGFSSPLFTAGPAHKYGLFRQMNNPMGFSTESNVFYEKSGISLSTSFYTGTKSFLFFEPYPDVIGLFLAHNQGQPLFWGGMLCMEFGECCFGEMLLSGAHPEPDNLQDTWFSEEMLFPGGHVAHLGAKLCVHPDSFSLSVTEIISGGKLILPGSFTHCALSWRTAYVLPELFIGFCTDEYITPEADYEDTGFKAGGKVTVAPVTSLSWYAGYEYAQNHPKPLYGDFLEAKETWKAGVEFIIPLTGRNNLSFMSDFKKRLMYDDAGHDTEETKAALSGEFESEAFTSKAGMYVTWCEQGVETLLKGDLSFSLQMHCLLIGGSFLIEEEPSWSAYVEYLLAFETISLYMELFTPEPLKTETNCIEQCMTDPLSTLSFTVGCEITY
jgi:hypothetical protein